MYKNNFKEQNWEECWETTRTWKQKLKGKCREQSNVFLVGQSPHEGPCVQILFDIAFESLASKGHWYHRGLCVMVPSSLGPLAASYYSPTFKNSREMRENHKLAIIKLVLAWKTIAREQLLEGRALPEGCWVLAVFKHSLASTLRPVLGILLKIECLFFMIISVKGFFL